MHNFLFGKRRTNFCEYSPFGSNNKSKPGIITQIKSKIQSLFLPTINPQSTIQRIQYTQDLEQELSYQFKNNLVLIDRIKPNQDKKQTTSRKQICSFEQYLKDEIDNKVSKEAQTDLSFKPNDSSSMFIKTKKQMKFKKNHAKIENTIKMEESQNEQEIKQKKNLQKKKEKEINLIYNEQQSNTSLQRIKLDSIPIKQSESSSNLFENQTFAIFQQNKSIDQSNQSQIKQIQCKFNRKKRIIQENQIISSSTGSHTKGEGYEMLFSMQNVSFSKDVEISSDSESIQINNNLYKLFHSETKSQQKQDESQKLIYNTTNQNSLLNSTIQMEKQQDNQSSDSRQLIQQIKIEDKIQDNEQNQQQQKIENLSDNKTQQIEVNYQEVQYVEQNNTFQEQSSNQIEQMQMIDLYYNSQKQVESIPCILNQQIFNVEQKQSNPFIQQNIKSINPFLEANTSITSDQINKYFSMGCQQTQSQQLFQNNFQNDLFKSSTTKQLFNFNQPIVNNNYENNKSMEIQQLDQYSYEPIQNDWNILNNIQKNVLSLFQDPNKLDVGKKKYQDLDIQQPSVNNSFNKGYRKKQRISHV